VQCDEIWSFVGSKEKNTTKAGKREGKGDAWTWTAIDADSKLIVSWLVGGRDAGYAHDFMHDVAGRLANRVQLTVDGHKPYLQAVASAFGNDIDFAQLIKHYGQPADSTDRRRYSPAECSGTTIDKTVGAPDVAHISTSYVERQNLTMRMSMRRFTRLTNGFSKKLANHEAAIALHFMYYNFCRQHKTLRVTPAMQAGVCDYIWSMEDVLNIVETMDR
jgi:IS1 family transposase